MSYPFVRYALIVGVLIALCSSLLGVTLVLKRFSFIGDGLSHVAFGALAIATVLKIADVNLFIMPVTIICAVLLLKTGNNTQIKGDSAIAMLSVGAMAVGYLILNVFSVSSNVSGDVCSTLFGSTSILTLTGSEVVMCIAASIIVVAFFVIFYNRIFSVTFDEDFTRSMGKNTGFYNMVIAVITAVIIVLAMNLVGSLLITALLVFPALSAMRIMKSFKLVIIYAAVLSVLGVVLGILKSPGEWGADIACGDAQSLGIPMSYGGPYIGYLCTNNALVRKMPGRLVGETTDARGNRCFVLTLQAREQHIRREKATSNICTAQGMMCLYVAAYLSLMGEKGLCEVNEISADGAHHLCEKLTKLSVFEPAFPEQPYLNEFTLKYSGKKPLAELLEALAQNGILAGVVADGHDDMLTEKRTPAEVEHYVSLISQLL